METGWTGRASVDSAGYRAVRAFRGFLEDQVFVSLTGQGNVPEEDRFQPPSQFEGPLWRIVSERPIHLLDPRFASWDEALLAAVDAMVKNGDAPGLAARGPHLGGAQHDAHPAPAEPRRAGARAAGSTCRSRPLPGDENMPRVQGPGFGASERMVVSPGHEETGLFEMPVGQSGHPLSPYYQNGETAWEEGKPTPFLPGPAVHHLRLVPR